ncbi:MAG TPA: hypothetical protein VES42_04055, partial [Pilimelia sp.]|nr:hypothetical protein [Pilimelia sp.]
MAGTPDPPHGGDARAGDLARPADAEAALSAAEAAHLAARDTEPIDVRGGRLADRETVRLPRQRRPAG